ncbi:fatty acid-binding protein, liver [Fundulus heteroclitus]|uniref:fatty acid-binding protein, liver n=1 Tax=Fundulus heteroclitus TaxID=8078 RepID=UPI00165B04C8|nr:fatty acid-binding protein, liver [Fundulus heteroclitus]
MIDPFVGTWSLDTSENFDEYLKEVGVNALKRGVATASSPDVVISKADDGFISMKAGNIMTPHKIKFKLNEEFDETTIDGRKARSTFTIENGKLVQKQSWDGKTTTLVREIKEGKLRVECTMGDITSVRVYKKK